MSDADRVLIESEVDVTDATDDEANAPDALVFPKVKKRRKGPYASDECGGEPPAMFLKGIHEFNEGEFFEQHETLETLWRLTESDIRYLYQGVLLIGVVFYHQEQNNFHGTQAKLAAGIEMLEWFLPSCQGVDVADLIDRRGQGAATGDQQCAATPPAGSSWRPGGRVESRTAVSRTRRGTASSRSQRRAAPSARVGRWTGRPAWQRRWLAASEMRRPGQARLVRRPGQSVPRETHRLGG